MSPGSRGGDPNTSRRAAELRSGSPNAPALFWREFDRGLEGGGEASVRELAWLGGGEPNVKVMCGSCLFSDCMGPAVGTSGLADVLGGGEPNAMGLEFDRVWRPEDGGEPSGRELAWLGGGEANISFSPCLFSGCMGPAVGTSGSAEGLGGGEPNAMGLKFDRGRPPGEEGGGEPSASFAGVDGGVNKSMPLVFSSVIESSTLKLMC
jgi:hypothetical protein